MYDGTQVVLVFDDTNTVKDRMLWGPQVDQLFAQENVVDGILWTLTDNLGSVRQVVEYDGTSTTLTETLDYDAFGNATTTPSSPLLFRFTGRYFDDVTKLQYNWHRWYDPGAGRWISQDPIGFDAGDVNLSRYVGNSPANSIDPTGFEEYLLPNGEVLNLSPEMAARMPSAIPNSSLPASPPPALKPYYPPNPPQYPLNWPPRPKPANPDIARAVKSCGGDPACERALGTLFSQISSTPDRGFYFPREDDKCFKWLDDFLTTNYPSYGRNSGGKIPLEGGAIILEPLELDTRGKARLTTSRSAFGREIGTMTGHGVVRVTFNPEGKKSCIGYFDLGSSTDLGHYGGPDHFFFPYTPGLGFEVEMDIENAKPYYP